MLELKLGNIYQHNKTKGRYVVLMLVPDATNDRDGVTMVLYMNITTNRCFVRRLTEFVEPGRFSVLEPAP